MAGTPTAVATKERQRRQQGQQRLRSGYSEGRGGDLGLDGRDDGCGSDKNNGDAVTMMIASAAATATTEMAPVTAVIKVTMVTAMM
jgi:hypothetical protein